MKYTCLVIDDEKILADSTCEYLSLFGVPSIVCYSTEEARSFLKSNSIQIVLLDINLGDGSGFELCKEIRETLDVPIVFISARTSDDDKIVALNIGGDDYIQKPYSLGVLLAKVKAILKRYSKNSVVSYSDGYLTVDFQEKQVYVNKKPIKLTYLEFKLLTYLIENQGKVLSKQDLFENVWKDKFTGDGTLNVHIRRIREAIEIDANNPKYITTIWGDGYKFVGKTV